MTLDRTQKLAVAGLAMLLALSLPAQAANFDVNDFATLKTALTNAANGDTITFTGDVTLTADLPAVQKNVTIIGNNHTLNGAGTYRGFLVANFNGGSTLSAVTVKIENLTITNTKASGGNGADGGGGGAGLGGAIFVADQANVTVKDVSLTGNSASGGNGAATGGSAGGGGGMGGNGGSTIGGGGGLGVGANGGNNVASGQGGIATGASSGGAAGTPGNTAAGADGGGGGGNNSGGGGGGAGGGGGVGGSAGGNSGTANGGAGGFGGGGGSMGSGGGGTVGGAGGFGGGGGSGSNGGAGGFGGGGGGGGVSGGAGGFGGGTSAAGGGGSGGAGLGGAIFVQQGGTLTVTGTLNIKDDNNVMKGNGAGNGSDGSQYGAGIFVQGKDMNNSGAGSLTFAPAGGETQTVSRDIADEAGNGGATANKWALSKSGAGTLTLTGANTYSGGTTVSGGLVNFTAGNNLGTGNITLNGGGLQWAAGNTTDISARLNALGASGASFDTNGNNVTFATGLSGSGALTKSGTGTLTLSGTNNYTGGTTVSAGTLQAGAANTFSSSSPITVASGATLDFNGFAQSIGSIAGAGTVALGGATLTTGGDNASTTLSGALGGTGALVKTGTGTLTLTGTNNYSGGTTVSAGTLAGTTTSLQGAIVNNATVTFDQTTNGTYAGAMSGTGSLTKAGSGTVTLSGTNNYSGGTTVSAGTLAGTTTSLQGAIVNNATVTFDQTTNGTYASIMSGTGALAKSGAGTVTLTGANNYSGGTTVNAGTLAGTTTSLQGAIVNNAAVTFDQTTNGTYAGAMSGTGSLTKSGTGTLTLTGANNYSGGTTVSAGTLAGTTTNLQGAIVNNAAVTFDQTTNGTYAGAMSGTGALTKAGSGTVTLSGTNNYSGGTTVSAGTLAGTTTSLQGAIVNNATVTFDQTTNGIYAGAMSGTGSLTKAGSGTVTLSGTNNYSGGTTVSAGTLAGTTTSLQGAIVNNAAVSFDQATDGTYAGIMSGTGALTKSGTGTVTLSGANTYSGGTSISAGTLNIASDGNLGNTAGGLALGGGTLQLATMLNSARAVTLNAGGGTVDTNGNDATLSGAIGGPGALTKSGAGTLTLSGANSYSGGTTVSAGTLAGTTTSLQGAIVNNAAVTFDQTTDGTYAGAMSGTGTLTKTGTGTVTLTGANNYSGGTTVSAGTLAGTTTSLQGAIVNNATVNFDQTADGTYAGIMSGTGALSKTGAGKLILSGDNTYTGATTVNAGTLSVNGSIASPVTINAGGILGGSGTINNAVTTASGGVFAPGNSIGTITVNGSLTFDADSIYRVEADAAGNADRVNVAGTPGTATINGGTVDVQAGAGTYQANTQYTILNATGGVTGTFAAVTSNLAFLTPTLAYDANNVMLELARNDLSLASVATTPNQQAVATVLQTSAASATGDLLTVVDTVTGLSAPQAQAAFDSIAGAGLVALRRAGAAFAGGFGQQLNRRLGLVASTETARQMAAFNSPLQLAANDWLSDAQPVYAQAGMGAVQNGSERRDGRGLWLRAYGADNRTDGDANATDDRLHASGLTLGADSEVRDGLVLGIAATTGNSHLTFSGVSDTGRSRGTGLGVYASYVAGPWTYKGIAGAAWNANHMDRNITVGAISRSATSDFDSRSQSLYAEAAYDIKQSGFVLQPLAALSYVRTKTDGYTESGAGALDLQVAAQTTESTRTLLGAKTVHEVGKLKVEPRLLWAHEFGNINAPLNASLAAAPAAGGFQTAGVALKRDSLIFGLGVSGELRKSVNLYADGQLENNSRQRNLALFIGARGVW